MIYSNSLIPSSSSSNNDTMDVDMSSPPRTPTNQPSSLPFASTGGVPWAPRRPSRRMDAWVQRGGRSPCPVARESSDSSDEDGDVEMETPARRLFVDADAHAQGSKSSGGLEQDADDVFGSRPARDDEESSSWPRQGAQRRAPRPACLFSSPSEDRHSGAHRLAPAPLSVNTASSRGKTSPSPRRRASPPTSARAAAAASPSLLDRRERKRSGEVNLNRPHSFFSSRGQITSHFSPIGKPMREPKPKPKSSADTRRQPPALTPLLLPSRPAATSLPERLAGSAELTRTASEGARPCSSASSSPLRQSFRSLEGCAYQTGRATVAFV